MQLFSQKPTTEWRMFSEHVGKPQNGRPPPSAAWRRARATAALKNASFPNTEKLLAPRFPPISSSSCSSLGAISTINALAVINTVLRAANGAESTGANVKWGKVLHWQSTFPLQLPFCASLAPKMVAGLWLAVWERRTNWQGRGRRRGGLWDWGGSLLFSFL